MLFLPFPHNRHIGKKYPATSVVTEPFGESGSATLTVSEYLKRLDETYSHGSHQAGPMRNISLVGVVQVCAWEGPSVH